MKTDALQKGVIENITSVTDEVVMKKSINLLTKPQKCMCFQNMNWNF